jgi:3',5'-cyclic AMP phosphodiesterase CpdA
MTRLFHVSDLHFGRENPVALDWFAGRVAAARPDAVILTGDLTMHARSAEFAAASAWLSGLGVPITIEPGNHDLPWFNPIARFLTPYRRFEKLERRIERPLELPGVMVVPLKTTARAQLRRNWSWGAVGARSLAAAIALLRRKPAGALALVACHHPLADREDLRSKARTHGGARAIEALAAAGADAVLSGHVHDPFDTQMPAAGGALRLIGAGTLSERTRATRPSYNELTIERGALQVAPHFMA